MNPEKLEKIFSLMKQFGVEYFKHDDFEVKLGALQPVVDSPQQNVVTKVSQKKKTPPSQAIPPVEMNIPHHENEVAKLMRLSDEDLVDKLFPDYSQMPQTKEAN